MDSLKPLSRISRRSLLGSMGTALSAMAVRELLGDEATGGRTGGPLSIDSVPRSAHAPTARSVIHLFMNGGPSQMDLFDPKPELTRRHGEDYFDSIAGEVEFPDAAGALLKSPFRFARHGECGMWVSDALPHFAKQVDRVAMIRSMHTTNLTHEPALYKIHSGSEFIGRPSLGAWVTYGLGSENETCRRMWCSTTRMVAGQRHRQLDEWLPPSVQGSLSSHGDSGAGSRTVGRAVD
ncbi:MAG: DUF1501 domain-containing protein [Pirellulaceae bacterium]